MTKELLSMIALMAEPILFVAAIAFCILAMTRTKHQRKQRMSTAWALLWLGIVQSLVWIGYAMFIGRG